MRLNLDWALVPEGITAHRFSIMKMYHVANFVSVCVIRPTTDNGSLSPRDQQICGMVMSVIALEIVKSLPTYLSRARTIRHSLACTWSSKYGRKLSSLLHTPAQEGNRTGWSWWWVTTLQTWSDMVNELCRQCTQPNKNLSASGGLAKK